LFWFTPIKAEPNSQEIITEDTKKKILEKYKDWHYPIQYLIENTRIEHLMRTDIWKMPVLPKWHEKQVKSRLQYAARNSRVTRTC